LLRYQCHRFAPVMLTADQSATIINSDSIASAIMVAYELVFFIDLHFVCEINSLLLIYRESLG